MRRGTSCRKIVLALILLLGALPACAFGSEVFVKSDTLFRVFERDTATEEDAAVLPGYEYLQIDAGKLSDYGLSFHLYGWGRSDLADNEYYEDQTAGELLYGYLEYRGELNQFSARLGRQYVFEGVANEAVDGLRLSGNLGEYFSLSLYGGQPVGLDSEEGRSGDSILGGRLAHRFGSLYVVGLSYKSVENDDNTADEKIGVDLAVFLPADLSFTGFSAYNQGTDGWAEHSYELRIPIDRLLLKPYFQQFAYEDYFGTGAKAVNPFRILAGLDEELTAYGLDALFRLNDAWTVGGKVKVLEYDRLNQAETFSVLAIWNGLETTEIGGEIGHTAADDTAGNDYTLARVYGYLDAAAGPLGLDFFSGDMVVAFYDEEIYGEDSSLFFSLGTGKRFLDEALTVKVSGDYSQDPYFDDDLRGLLTLSYIYDQH